jgi:hypothetical protein
VWNYEKTVSRTAEWYRSYYENKAVKSTDDIRAYVKNAAEKGLCWTLVPLQNSETLAACQNNVPEKLCATV